MVPAFLSGQCLFWYFILCRWGQKEIIMKMLHLSDLHIHKSNEKSENKHLKEIVENIIKLYPNEKPVILITGDIVDDGRKDQYKNAVELLKPLVNAGFTILPTPGNHDYGKIGNFYTEKSQAYFQKYILGELIKYPKAMEDNVEMEDLYPMKTIIDNVLFIGIDSVVGAEDKFMHFAGGTVGKRQRKALENILSENMKDEENRKDVVVYFHHHPFTHTIGMTMSDADKVLRALSGKIDILCFGHKHHSSVYNNKYDIEWILASGKSTNKTSNYKLQFREIELTKEKTSVAMVSFKTK